MLSVFLVLLIVSLFFIQPMGLRSGLARFLLEIFMTCVTLGGAYVVWKDRWGFYVAAAVALAATILSAAQFLWPFNGVRTAASMTLTVYMTILTSIVLTFVFQPGPVTRMRVQGAIAAYILIGLTWGLFYEAIERFAPMSFNLKDNSREVVDLRPQLVYFSFTTLTSVGYGDITPNIPFTRSMSMLEALNGQLYLAILIAHLVSEHGQTQRRSRRKPRKSRRPHRDKPAD